MRNTLIIILICLFATSSYGQNYTPILSAKNEWHINSIGPGLSVDHFFFTGEDTLIDSIKHFPLIWKSHNSSYPDFFMGYLKEDSTNQSLSFFEADPNGVIDWNDEKHLYQFNLLVGDTVYVDSKDQYPETPFYKDTLKVKSIQYQNSTNQCFQNSWIRDSVKLLNLSSIRANQGSENDNITWLEGTGSLSFLLMPGWGRCFPTELSCHHKDDLLLYRSASAQNQDTCLFATPLEEDQLSINFTISPNPIYKLFTLSYDNPRGEEREIILRNLQGQRIWTERSRAETIKIQRQNWAAGVYLVEVFAEGQRIGQSKIIFQ